MNSQASDGSLHPAPASGVHSAFISCVSVAFNECEALKERSWSLFLKLALKTSIFVAFPI